MDAYCSECITDLAEALISVQKKLTPAIRDGNNPFTRSNYATLNSVMESCRDILLDHGIWLTQIPVPAPVELGPGHIGLMSKLTHAKSGQWQASLTVIPLPKADPQGMGSAITYARRYALTAMLGMISEDDDGEAAKLTPRQTGMTKNSPKSTPSKIGQQKNDIQSGFQTTNSCISDDPTLPELDGITYQYTTGQDGRQCVIAIGNTHPKKEILSGAGFRWSAQRKIWWKYADAS